MKDEKKTQIRRSVLNYGVSALLAIAGSLAAAIPAVIMRERGLFLPAAKGALCGVIILLVLWIPVSLLLTKKFTGRLNRQKVANANAQFAEEKEAALSDLKAQYRRIKRIAGLVKASELGFFVLLYAVIFLHTLVEGGTGYSTICTLILFYYFTSVGFFKYFGFFQSYKKEADYPELYALIRRAQRDSHVTGKVHLDFTPDFNAGINRVGGRFSILLGTALLDICSEEELYAVLLHEFAHMKAESCPGFREQALFRRITEGGNFFLNLVFRFPYGLYEYSYILYISAASVAIELAADRALLNCSSGETAASMLAKLSFSNLFLYEQDMHVTFGPYDKEKPMTNQASCISHKFKEVLPERAAFWKALQNREIEARNASHPILTRRLAALGITDYTVSLPEDAGTAYRRECDRAMAEMDKLLLESISENYEENRKEAYLDQRAIFEPYQDSDSVPPVEEIRDAVYACQSVYDSQAVLEFCDRLIAAYRDVNDFALAGVYFTKGGILLHRYDKAGMELVYKAIDMNGNYAEDGYAEIGQFIFLMGLADEVDGYRESVYSYNQKQIDGNRSIGEFTKKDDLHPTDLPKETVAAIKAYIDSISEGKIAHVYTVKKVLKTGELCYPWIIEFLPETDGETADRVMDKIFLYLDTYPAEIQFSLFAYDKTSAAALKKYQVQPLKDCTSRSL